MRRLRVRVTVPEEGSSCPMRMRRRVVLPMPFGPTSASRAPLVTEKDTLAKRSSAPKDFEREFTVMRDILQVPEFCRQYCVMEETKTRVDFNLSTFFSSSNFGEVLSCPG